MKKVGEESAETIIAAKNGDLENLTGEVCDLLYHLLVMMQACGLPLDAVFEELSRQGTENRQPEGAQTGRPQYLIQIESDKGDILERYVDQKNRKVTYFKD